MQNKKRNYRSAQFLFLLSCSFLLPAVSSQVCAQDTVDVYIIAGQSNAANFAQRAGTGSTEVGYNLTFARDRTIFTDPSHTDQAFASGSLNNSQAVTILSQGLFESNDQAILGFARSGTSISVIENTRWYPGADPANGFVDDTSFYGDFINWTNARLAEITASGRTPVVKGLFWFQGERDAVLGSAAVGVYETNFENLAFRFRQDFGLDLPIIATEIREGVAQNAALRDDVNAAIRNVAAADPRMSLVGIQNLSFVNSNDVHLNTAGYQALAPLWAAEATLLQESAQTVLQYDSVDNGNGTASLRVLNTLTATDLVASEEIETSFGGNTTDTGQHPTQQFTVSFGNANDKLIRFGSDNLIAEGGQLDGTLADAVLDDGEWVGASLTAADDFQVDSFSFEMFVNTANINSWAARDAGLFLRIGNTGPFTQFGSAHQGTNGNNGTVEFTDAFDVNAGDELQWRLAFTNRTNVSVGLPATLTTRIGSIRLNAVSAAPEFLLGDVNRDGLVNFLDIAPFIGLLQSSEFQLEGDINQDDNVDFLDISPFIGLLSS